jgi:hypothetical protein
MLQQQYKVPAALLSYLFVLCVLQENHIVHDAGDRLGEELLEGVRPLGIHQIRVDRARPPVKG